AHHRSARYRHQCAALVYRGDRARRDPACPAGKPLQQDPHGGVAGHHFPCLALQAEEARHRLNRPRKLGGPVATNLIILSSTDAPPPRSATSADSNDANALSARLNAALELLEAIAADRTLLDEVPKADRSRLHQAVAKVYHPEPGQRRQKLKAQERERNADNIRRADEVLNQTGIRALRRKPVFTALNYFPPHGPGGQPKLGHGVSDATPAGEESPELLHCYVCKQKYTLVHH